MVSKHFAYYLEMHCVPEEQIQNVWKVYLMLLKSIKLEINDIELTVYVCMGRICPWSKDMAFLSLERMFAGRDIRKLQGTPFQLAQVKSEGLLLDSQFFF